MGFIIGLLTLVMVLDSVVLIFLVLIQLPKKDAGAGLAFGATATDALFGAGSGTVLTKITKYAAGGFFVLAMVLSVLQSNYHRRAGSEFSKRIDQAAAPLPSRPPTTPAAAPATNVTQAASATNLLTTSAAELTNVPAPVAAPAPATTNAPAAPK
jgi:preprotein translocase subunit SecG